MIRNISYNNPQISTEINNAVGESFGWWMRLRMGGIGSRRMLIQDASPDIWHLLNHQNTAKHCYLELRPGGVIIHFRSILESMGWIITYQHLNLNGQGDFLELRGEDRFMIIGGANYNPPDYSFLEKMQHYQAKWLESQLKPE